MRVFGNLTFPVNLSDMTASGFSPGVDVYLSTAAGSFAGCGRHCLAQAEVPYHMLGEIPQDKGCVN